MREGLIWYSQSRALRNRRIKKPCVEILGLGAKKSSLPPVPPVAPLKKRAPRPRALSVSSPRGDKLSVCDDEGNWLSIRDD